MVSIDGLLDAHEVSVRARVEALREQAARVAVQVGEAELALEHVAITRATLALVAAGGEMPAGQGVASADAPDPPLVPVWRSELTEAHLPDGYRVLRQAVANAPGPVRAKDLALVPGLPTTAAKVEGLRCKLKRLAARAWIAEPAPGAFALASTGPASPDGAS